MNIIDCDDWEEAKAALKRIRQKHQYSKDDPADDSIPWKRTWRNRILYRGHSNAEWDILTTLDRHSNSEWTLYGYIESAAECLPQIEAIYPRQWGAVDHDSIAEFSRKRTIHFESPPLLPFLIYLRHHGYPSFLLDWTLSPLIAAHFAVANSKMFERMAIFVFCETLVQKETRPVSYKPRIQLLTRSALTHSRHFLQQSCYTYCTRFDKKDKENVICHHADALLHIDKNRHILYKITFPASERMIIIRELMANNINDFSLFQSEESLVRSLALQNLDLEYDYEDF